MRKALSVTGMALWMSPGLSQGVVPGLGAGSAVAAERTITVEVGGLWCASCPDIAAQAIQSFNSAEIVDGFYDRDKQLAQFVVTFDDLLTDADMIVASTSEFGYPAQLVDKLAC